MGTLAITFRFKDDGDREERYESFMKYFEGKKTWEETTSFVLLDSELSASEVAAKLYLTKFSPSRDKLLVIDVTGDVGQAWGNITMPFTLKSLMPKVVIS